MRKPARPERLYVDFEGHPANGEVGGALAIEIRSNPVYFCSGILLKDIYQ